MDNADESIKNEDEIVLDAVEDQEMQVDKDVSFEEHNNNNIQDQTADM